MDPDEALRRIRELAAELLDNYPGTDFLPSSNYETDATALAEKVQDLDGWLSRGGFAPQAWQPRG